MWFHGEEEQKTIDRREAHGTILSSLDIDAARVRVQGRLYHAVGRFAADFRTATGPVPVTRTLYRESGVRNGPTVDPIALRIGAVERHWLPRTAKAIAFLLQQGTSREADATTSQVGRLPYSRSSMERSVTRLVSYTWPSTPISRTTS
jgi:hypothetical protein